MSMRSVWLSIAIDASASRRARYFAERLGALLVLLVDRIGVHARAHVAAAVRTRLIQHHQFVRVLHRQPAQQDLVDQREDRGVRPDAEREREDRDDREQRASKEAAHGQLEVIGWQRHSGELDGPQNGMGCYPRAAESSETFPRAAEGPGSQPQILLFQCFLCLLWPFCGPTLNPPGPSNVSTKTEVSCRF